MFDVDNINEAYMIVLKVCLYTLWYVKITFPLNYEWE